MAFCQSIIRWTWTWTAFCLWYNCIKRISVFYQLFYEFSGMVSYLGHTWITRFECRSFLWALSMYTNYSFDQIEWSKSEIFTYTKCKKWRLFSNIGFHDHNELFRWTSVCPFDTTCFIHIYLMNFEKPPSFGSVRSTHCTRIVHTYGAPFSCFTNFCK